VRGAERCPAKKHDTLETNHEKLPPIKTILGIETYVADAGRTTGEGDWGHLVLLARNEVGYHNLIQLTSLASLEGFYSRRVSTSSCSSASVRGSSPPPPAWAGIWLRRSRPRPRAADELIRTYQRLVGAENYYLELQWPTTRTCRRAQGARAARPQPLPDRSGGTHGAHLVMANDLHYAVRHDAVAEEVVLATQQKMTIAAVREERPRVATCSGSTP